MKLEIRSVSKTYKNGIKALEDVTLTVGKGIFGLLGPNGSGKSSLMRTIVTLQQCDTGGIYLNNVNIQGDLLSFRRLLGYLPQDYGVYPKLSAEKMLDYLALLKGMCEMADRKNAVEYYLTRVNLWNDRKKNLGTFSGGMKQRFGIAQALIGSPKIIVVDEPTAGLDPSERMEFYNILSEIGEENIVILSTHIVEDLSTLCSNFAIISTGKVIHNGSPDDSIRELKDRVYDKIIKRHELDEFRKGHRVISTHLIGGEVCVRIISEENPQNDFKATTPTLEDVYFVKSRSV